MRARPLPRPSPVSGLFFLSDMLNTEMDCGLSEALRSESTSDKKRIRGDSEEAPERRGA